MSADRRATIAAALDAAEKNNGEVPDDFIAPVQDTEGNTVDASKPLVNNDAKVESTLVDDKGVVDASLKSPTDAPKPDGSQSEDKPPQSWRAAQKAKWATVDPEVKSEILRRERDHERVLSESSNHRQIAQGFHQVVQPFMARIQSLGVHPMVAAQELFKADHILNTAPMPQRAQLMAKLVKDYGIDVLELDKALSGTVTPSDPVQNEVQRLLQEQLAPVHRFIEQQSQTEQQRRQQEVQQADSTVEQMAADNVKFPFFDAVRSDMADIIEIQTKKGIALSLEQAYTRAIAMNPEVSQKVAQQQEQSRRQQAARTQNGRAQRALAASVSVTGAPNGAPNGIDSGKMSRRDTIAAAFDSLEGR